MDGINLSKMSNETKAIVHMEETLVNIMKGTISFAGAFKLQFGLKFMQSRIKDIVGDMVLFNYLPTHSQSSYL